jgi:hypothetical protein
MSKSTNVAVHVSNINNLSIGLIVLNCIQTVATFSMMLSSGNQPYMSEFGTMLWSSFAILYGPLLMCTLYHLYKIRRVDKFTARPGLMYPSALVMSVLTSITFVYVIKSIVDSLSTTPSDFFTNTRWLFATCLGLSILIFLCQVCSVGLSLAISLRLRRLRHAVNSTGLIAHSSLIHGDDYYSSEDDEDREQPRKLAPIIGSSLMRPQ